MLCVVLVQLCESININVLFPFVPFMVEDFGYRGELLGYYSGILAASFCAAQFCSSIPWGIFSDVFGRKSSAIIGVLGSAIGLAIFGFAKNYEQAIIGRMISGFLCGNLGVLKTFLTEITDDTNQGTGFSLLSIAWAIGTVLAPLAGGMLSNPSKNYPHYFGNINFFIKYPYSLPCLICCFINILTAFISFILMKETKVFQTKSNNNNNNNKLENQHSLHKKGLKYNFLSTEEELDSSSHPLSSTMLDISMHTDHPNPNHHHQNNNNNKLKELNTYKDNNRNLISKNGNDNHEVEEEEEDDTLVEITLYESMEIENTNRMGGTQKDTSSIMKNTNYEETQNNNNARSNDSNDNNSNNMSYNNNRFSIVQYLLQFKSEEDKHLYETNVLLTTCNYGLLSFTYTIYDETIPLFLKQDSASGGLNYDTAMIGFVIAISGVIWLLFTIWLLPFFASGSKLRMFRLGIVTAVPVTLLWPMLGFVQSSWVLQSLSHPIRHTFISTMSILLSLARYTSASLSFTAVMILINHSVSDEYSARANGLGQCLAALARTIGPALGGAIWSLGTKFHSTFLIFISVVASLFFCLILNSFLPAYLDHKHDRKQQEYLKIHNLSSTRDSLTTDNSLEFSDYDDHENS